MVSHRTSFPEIRSEISISHAKNLVFLGSCFSRHISRQCEMHGFSTMSNPLEISYNAHSLKRQARYLLEVEIPDNKLFIDKENRVYHFDFHTLIFGDSRSDFLNKIKEQTKLLQAHLKKPIVLFLTLGTAWIHEHKKMNVIVSNCHKFPKNTFTKRLLTIQEICDSILDVYRLFSSVVTTELVLTISPVRHLKDGFVENQRSKARLVEGIHQLKEACASIEYFPSYELVMDDLRDYRYFKEDMLHPNSTAIEYIWTYFKQAYFNEKTRNFAIRAHKIFQRNKHKPFNPNAQTYHEFLDKTEQLRAQLIAECPDIHFKRVQNYK